VDKYSDVTTSICECLGRHGWVPDKGFKTEPNRLNIANDLQKIVDIYF